MRIKLLLALLLVTLSAVPGQARNRAGNGQAFNPTGQEKEVLHDFEQILDFWRDGKYDDLFERTSGGKESSQQFAKRLTAAPRRPACCWEKMQEARVSLKNDHAATVRARLGFEGGVSGTEFVTKGIKLTKEDGLWIISQSELFSLANLSKKRVRYKYLPIQPK